MIKIQNFSKKYNDKYVLKDVNVEFPEKKINFLMGKNGAGKTTLVKCIGELEKYTGKIIIDGCNYKDKRNEFMMLWDDCPFYDNLSGADNLRIFACKEYKKSELEEKVVDFITPDLLCRKVKEYSYGQKKKLALALVELKNPKYLIMDEITNGLDYDTLLFLRDRVVEWAKSKTVILTGHQFGFYNGLVENVFVYRDKTIIREVDYNKNDVTLEEVYRDRMH